MPVTNLGTLFVAGPSAVQVPANLVRAEIVHYDFAADAPVRCRFAKRTT
jgi:hypothetical protein